MVRSRLSPGLTQVVQGLLLIVTRVVDLATLKSSQRGRLGRERTSASDFLNTISNGADAPGSPKSKGEACAPRVLWPGRVAGCASLRLGHAGGRAEAVAVLRGGGLCRRRRRRR